MTHAVVNDTLAAMNIQKWLINKTEKLQEEKSTRIVFDGNNNTGKYNVVVVVTLFLVYLLLLPVQSSFDRVI